MLLPPRLAPALAVALALLSSGAARAESPAAAAETLGVAMPIGGSLRADNEAVWGRLIELAGGPGARFVVLGTASEDPAMSAGLAVAALQRRGAIAEALPVSPLLAGTDVAEEVRDPALIEKVRAARGIYFTGGSQERIVEALAPGGRASPMLDAIWEVYRRGGLVAGTSAGAAVMSAVMFRDAPSVLGVMKGRLREGREVTRGLGFVGPKLFVDQHFLKRGRIGRMIPLMLAKGYTLGLGIEENSAAVIHGDDVEILGGRGALLVDLSQAHSDANLGVFNVTAARLTYLDNGDRVNLASLSVAPSPLKRRGQKLDPSARDYKPFYTNEPFYVDMVGDNTIANAMSFLIDSNRSEVRGLSFDARPNNSDPLASLGFSFRLYKGDGSVGWYSDAQGGDNYTVANVYLDITPVRMAQPIVTPWTPAVQSED